MCVCVCVCVCVCLVLQWVRGYFISVGPVMRLVHPITSPFAFLAFLPSHLRADLGQAGPVFSPRAVLGTLAGMTFTRKRLQALERYPSRMVGKLGA